MRQAGEVVHTKVNLDQTGRSKGNGFIEFATRGEALEAIKLLDETELDGRVITVREDREEPAFAEGGARGGGEGCFLCGQPGHLKRDCPQSGGGGGPFKSATDSAQTCHNWCAALPSVTAHSTHSLLAAAAWAT